MSKGLELPTNTLIMIIVAVIVLLAVVAFFLGIWPPRPITLENALNNGCQKWLLNGCDTGKISSIEVGNYKGDSTSETLENVKIDLGMDDTALKNRCACPTI